MAHSFTQPQSHTNVDVDFVDYHRAELVPPFVETVTTLLHGPRRPWCLLLFRDRAGDKSETFVHMESVVDAFRASGCDVTHVSEHEVLHDRDRSKTADASRKVAMYEVRLCGS